VIPRGEFAGKIRAAADARTDRDLLIIARTDAISAMDFDEALRRGEAAIKAGARTCFFVEAPRDEKQVERGGPPRSTPPCSTTTRPAVARRCCRSRGCASWASRSSFCPWTRCSWALRAIAEFLAEVRKRDDVLSLTDRYMHFSDFNRLIGVMDQNGDGRPLQGGRLSVSGPASDCRVLGPVIRHSTAMCSLAVPPGTGIWLPLGVHALHVGHIVTALRWERACASRSRFPGRPTVGKPGHPSGTVPAASHFPREP